MPDRNRDITELAVRMDTLLLEGSDSGPPITVTPEYWQEKKRKLTERLGKAIRPR